MAGVRDKDDTHYHMVDPDEWKSLTKPGNKHNQSLGAIYYKSRRGSMPLLGSEKFNTLERSKDWRTQTEGKSKMNENMEVTGKYSNVL